MKFLEVSGIRGLEMTGFTLCTLQALEHLKIVYCNFHKLHLASLCLLAYIGSQDTSVLKFSSFFFLHGLTHSSLASSRPVMDIALSQNSVQNKDIYKQQK